MKNINDDNSTKLAADQPLSEIVSNNIYLKRYLPYLSNPPMLPTESGDDYWILMDELFAELRPNGLLESQYIEDVVYNSWQIRKLRKVQADVVRQAMIEIGTSELSQILYLDKRGLFEEFSTESGAVVAAKIAMQNALAGNKEVANAIEAVMVDMVGLSWACLHAQAIDRVLTSYSRFEQMIQACERQRQNVFRDFVFLGQAKAMLLEQRSNEAISMVSDIAIPGTVNASPIAAEASGADSLTVADAASASNTSSANHLCDRAHRSGGAHVDDEQVKAATAPSTAAPTMATANTAGSSSAMPGST